MSDCGQSPTGYNRDKLRCASDLTYAFWAHIEPLFPFGKPGIVANGASISAKAEERQ